MSNFPYQVTGPASQGPPSQENPNNHFFQQQPPYFSTSSFQSLINTYGSPLLDNQPREFADRIPRDPEKFFKDELNKATSPSKKPESCTSSQGSPQRALIKIKDFSQILENDNDVQFLDQKQTTQINLNIQTSSSSYLGTPPMPVPAPLVQVQQNQRPILANPLMMYSFPTRTQIPLPPSLSTWRDPQQKPSQLQPMRFQINPNPSYNAVTVSDPRSMSMPMPINTSNYNIFMNPSNFSTAALKTEGSQWNNYRHTPTMPTFQTTQTPQYQSSFQSQINIPTTVNKGAGLPEILASDEDAISNDTGTSRLREFIGYVTSIDENFGTGMIENNIFFQMSCVKGEHPKLHQKVFVLAEYVENMPFTYNAKLVRVLLEGSSFSLQNSSTSQQSSSLANNSTAQTSSKHEEDSSKSLFTRTGKKAPPAPKISADVRHKRSRSRSPRRRLSSPQPKSKSRSSRRRSSSRSHSPDFSKKRAPPPPMISRNRSRSRSPAAIALLRRSRNRSKSPIPIYTSLLYNRERERILKASPPPLNDRIISPLMNKRILQVSPPPPLYDGAISPLMNKRITITPPLQHKRFNTNSDKNRNRNDDQEPPESIKSKGKEITDSKRKPDTKTTTNPSRKHDSNSNSNSKAERVKLVGILKSPSSKTTLPNPQHGTSNDERMIGKSNKGITEEIDMFDVDDSHFQLDNSRSNQKDKNLLVDVTSCNDKNRAKERGKASGEKIKVTAETSTSKKDVYEIEQDRVKIAEDKIEELEEIWETDSVEELRKRQEKEKAISEMTCRNCGQLGHVEMFCFVTVDPDPDPTTTTVKNVDKKSEAIETASNIKYDELTGFPIDLEEDADDNIKVKQWLDKSEDDIIGSPLPHSHSINQDQQEQDQVIETDIDKVETNSVEEVGKLIEERIAEREKLRRERERQRQMNYNRNGRGRGRGGGRSRSRGRARGRYRHPSDQSSPSHSNNNIVVADNANDKNVRESPKRYIRGRDFDIPGSRSLSRDRRRRFSPPRPRRSPNRQHGRLRSRSRTPPHFRRGIRSRTRTRTRTPPLRRSRSISPPRSPVFYRQHQNSPPPPPEHYQQHHVSVQDHGFTLTRTVFQDIASTNIIENRRIPSPVEPEIVYFEHPPLHPHPHSHTYTHPHPHSHIYTHPHPNPNLVQHHEERRSRSRSISGGRQRRSSSRGRRMYQRSPPMPIPIPLPPPNLQHFPRQFSRSPSTSPPNPHFRRQVSRSRSPPHPGRGRGRGRGFRRPRQQSRSFRGREGELEERERMIQQREYELSLELERFGYGHDYGRSTPPERVKIRMMDDLTVGDSRPRGGRPSSPSPPLPPPPRRKNHRKAICKCCGKLGHFWDYCFHLKPGDVFSDSDDY